MRIYIK